MPDRQELAANQDAGLALTTLGGAALERISGDGTRVSLLGPGKPHALLVYLACSPGRSASRDHLTDVLWGDVSPERARHALRHTLWLLRDRLGEAAIEGTDGDLHLARVLDSDRDAFLAAVERREFETAVELYRGEFLPGFAAPGAADFEQWADRERYHLRHMFLRAAEAVVRDRLSKGRLRKAKQLATRVRDADPSNEASWRLLLESLLAAEDRVAAELEAHELAQVLRADGRPPEPATLRLLERARARAGEDAGQTEEAPARKLVAELIGREREFGTILGAWERARHGPGQHVHVAGAAGLGKTRLLADVLARLRAMGACAISVRANPGERQVSYALASDVALAAAGLPGSTAVSPAAAGALVALNPSLSDRYTAAADRAVDAEALRRREIALGELLSAVAYEQPVAFLVDDVHWADAASMQLLRSVLSKLGEHHVFVVTSARPGPEAAVVSGATLSIALEPLSVEETGALVASLGVLPGESWSRALPAALHDSAQGSPLLILETLRLALESEVLALRDGVWECSDPGALAAELARGGALRRRIEELERNEGWVLLLLSVAGTPLDATLLANAAGRSPEAVLESLSGLEVRGFGSRDAGDWQPAHDEIAARAMEAASPEARRAAHRAVGEALADSAGDDPTLLTRAGRHFAQASDEAGLRASFARWARVARRRGEGRSLKRLAAEYLGNGAGVEAAGRLVAGLKPAQRLALATPRTMWIGLGAAGLAAAAAAVLVLRPNVPPPDAGFLAVYRVRSDSALVYDVPVRREGWETRRSITVTRPGRPLRAWSRLAAAAFHYGSLVASPDGRRWALVRVVPDSGGTELFVADRDARERRLTYSRKDDVAPDWSPDGRSLVYLTGRWNRSGRFNVALLDVETGSVRRLTRGDANDGEPKWSPDGTRIAFARELVVGHGPGASGSSNDLLCWIPVSGAPEHCFVTQPVTLHVLGWYDFHQVLATSADTLGRSYLVRVDVDTREAKIVSREVTGDFSASADGRWVACLCDRPGIPGYNWYVFPSDRPDLALPLIGPDSASHMRAFWWLSGNRPAYIAHLKVRVPAGPVAVGSLERLRAQGFDGTGHTVPVLVLTWRTADASVASIDSVTGELRPHRVGSVIVHASAGGWREDSARVVIGRGGSSTLITEDWSGRLGRWVPFGVPLATVTTGPDGRLAFWNNGDGSFYSGAYTREGFSSASGLGLQVRVFSPMSAYQDQIWSISLVTWTDSASVAKWDHHTGSLPSEGMSECTFGYPGGEGAAGLQAVRFHASGAPERILGVGRTTSSGKPYDVRLQVFGDGRCGLAVNDKPLWIASSGLPLGVPYRVVLQGKSVGNKMLVGHLEVWEGVKPGVNWTAAPR